MVNYISNTANNVFIDVNIHIVYVCALCKGLMKTVWMLQTVQTSLPYHCIFKAHFHLAGWQ